MFTLHSNQNLLCDCRTRAMQWHRTHYRNRDRNRIFYPCSKCSFLVVRRVALFNSILKAPVDQEFFHNPVVSFTKFWRTRKTKVSLAHWLSLAHSRYNISLLGSNPKRHKLPLFGGTCGNSSFRSLVHDVLPPPHGLPGIKNDGLCQPKRRVGMGRRWHLYGRPRQRVSKTSLRVNFS